MIIDKMTPYLSIIPIERMCTVTVIVCIRYIIGSICAVVVHLLGCGIERDVGFHNFTAPIQQ